MTSVPHVEETMHSAMFWIEHLQLGEEPLFTPEDRAQWHALWVRQGESLVDLVSVSPTIPAHRIRTWLDADDQFEDTLFTAQNVPLEPSFWLRVRENCNRPVEGSQIACRYAFATARASLRTLPTSTGAFKEGQVPHFDRMQETAIHLFEPLIVFHSSGDGLFSYVQMHNYRGWVQSDEIAMTDRQTFLDYVGNEHFLTAADSFEIQTHAGSKRIEYGARLPLQASSESEWSVLLPGRTEFGRFYPLVARVDIGPTAQVGPLSSTRRTLLEQAFRLLGEAYGWGDEQGLHDCSSFVMDVYRTIGLDLPRNAGEQERLVGVAKSVFSATMTPSERRAVLLRSHQAGDLLYMAGHTMIYLGEWEGRLYVLHDYSGYAVAQGQGDFRSVTVMEIGVSPLELHLTSGKTFLEALTTAISFAGFRGEVRAV
ncbi:MAG: NlpC/P60 family protein [Firmicutes bacterium]|nr:NlpC/P60 family protein [Bacillota bacterium]